MAYNLAGLPWLSANQQERVKEKIVLQATVGGSQEPDRPVLNPIGLVVRARTQARRLAECHPTAIQLERLAARLEHILTERRRLKKSLGLTFDE